MRKILFYTTIITLLLVSCKPRLEKDVNEQAENHLGKIININKDGIGEIKMGDSFKKCIKYLPHTEINKNEDGILELYNEDDLIIEICDKNYGNDEVLVWTRIYSSNYILPRNIHVGSSLNEFLEKFSINKMYYNELDEIAFFEITQFDKLSESFSTICVEFESITDISLINDDNFSDIFENGYTNNYHTDGKIVSIYIHK